MGIFHAFDGLLRRLRGVDRAILVKAISFAMIGLVNTGIDFGVFTFTYYYLGWHILVANPIAWLMAVSNSYVLNSMITFAAETGRRLSVKAYITFILTQAGGLIANTTTVFLLSYFMPAWMAKIPAIGASFIVDFTLSHLVVFRRQEELSNSERSKERPPCCTTKI